MEHLEFKFSVVGNATTAAQASAIVGVVGSGNLEVLIENEDLDGTCEVSIDTSIHRFGATWERVLADFVERHRLSNIRISINDGGATPAVVALRLDQAIADLLRGSR
ncbi:MAG: malonate decarboxylase acyl carrier protein [Burkholderiales bacterium]|nr:malonate decarboxylase acyl carrier protein [Burkholderiales bacterium]